MYTECSVSMATRLYMQPLDCCITKSIKSCTLGITDRYNPAPDGSGLCSHSVILYDLFRLLALVGLEQLMYFFYIILDFTDHIFEIISINACDTKIDARVLENQRYFLPWPYMYISINACDTSIPSACLSCGVRLIKCPEYVLNQSELFFRKSDHPGIPLQRLAPFRNGQCSIIAFHTGCCSNQPSSSEVPHVVDEMQVVIAGWTIKSSQPSPNTKTEAPTLQKLFRQNFLVL